MIGVGLHGRVLGYMVGYWITWWSVGLYDGDCWVTW